MADVWLSADKALPSYPATDFNLAEFRAAGCDDLNPPSAIASIGILFMEGQAEPAEIRTLKARFGALGGGAAHAGEWLAGMAAAAWPRESVLLDEKYAEAARPRYRTIATNWIGALETVLSGRLLILAVGHLNAIDFTPKAIRAAKVESAETLALAAGIIGLAANLEAMSGVDLSGNDVCWTSYRRRFAGWEPTTAETAPHQRIACRRPLGPHVAGRNSAAYCAATNAVGIRFAIPPYDASALPRTSAILRRLNFFGEDLMRGVSAIALAAALVLAAFGSSVPARAQAPAVTAFEGARLIVGDGRASIENGTIVVEGTKILQAGAAADVRVPAGATIVNLAGKTIMPTLIDTHTHLSQTREGLTQDLKRRAYYGVSAALSMGTADTTVDLEMRGASAPGMARVFTAWRGITRPEVGRGTAPFWINSEQEGRKAVQELAARKVDIVKVWVDDRDGKYAKMTPALYGAVIDEAHKDGLRVTAHIFTLEDAKGLLRAGVDAFAHSVRDRDVDDEFMALVKQHPNLVVNPNLPDRGVKTDVSWLRASLPAAEMQRVEQANTDRPKAQEFYGIQARNLAKLSAAGVRIILGTDGNTPWAPHVEMADMVAAGMTPAQVIVAATRNAAEFLRMTDAGTLETGKSADFIVLDANPLDDITNTRRIAAVYLRGAAVDRTKAP